MFEITIKTDNPDVLAAIAKAVKSVPPVGLEISGEPKVNVHATLKDMKAATENVNLNPEATVNEVPLDEAPATEAPKPEAPKPEAPAKTDEEARNERRAKLRQLVTAAGEKMEGGIPAAMAEAIKVSSVKEAKDLPDCDNFDAVCEALVALVA